GLVFTAVHGAPVDHLADIEAVLEQVRERAHAKVDPADGAAVRKPPRLAADPPAIEFRLKRAHRAELQIACKDRADRLCLGRHHTDLLVHRGITERDRPPTQIPLRLEAAILSRTRSPMSSRSNWANDSSTLSVSRPMLELVLKDCVTDTNETPWASNSSMSWAKSASERVNRSTL